MAGKITALAIQKRNRKRVSVYLDGQFAFGLAATDAARLRVGQWLDRADIEALQATDERQAAYQRALNFLSYRPRSAQEVRRNLAEKGFPNTAIEATLERLEQVGQVNDLEFAHYWVDQRQTFRPRGVAMLRHELRQKGVNRACIAAALEAVDEEALAYQAAQPWANRSSNLSAQDFKRKLSSFLARRGFSYTIVRTTMDRLQDELKLDLENQGINQE